MQTAAPMAAPDPTKGRALTTLVRSSTSLQTCFIDGYAGSVCERQRRRDDAFRACLPESFRGELQFESGRAPRAIGFDGRLSLSHCQTFLLAAVSSAGYLGVDIECSKPRDNQRLERFLGWNSASVDLSHFYRRWTLGEALIKTGWAGSTSALRGCFEALDVATPAGAPAEIEHDDSRFSLSWPSVGHGLTCAVVEVDPR